MASMEVDCNLRKLAQLAQFFQFYRLVSEKVR